MLNFAAHSERFLPFNTRQRTTHMRRDYCLVSASIICLVAGGSDEPNSRTLPRYQKSADIIINTFNGEGAKIIPFAPQAKKQIDLYGQDKFYKYDHDKFGRITHCGPPTILIDLFVKFQITAEKGRWSMVMEFGEDGVIEGMAFVDPDPIIQVPARNSMAMRLPFREEWHVRDGGPTIELNSHMTKTDDKLRGAVDFTMLDERGSPYKHDANSLKNEHFYAYGKDILAVADGEVVTAIDGVPDNRPYTVNESSLFGNAIILKHADREFSLYAHLKLSSTRVKVGQKVVAGQTIGQCGNSGQSTGPHLHFGLVNTEIDSDARGFMAYFNNVIVTRPVLTTIQNAYTPLRGDRVQSKE